MSYIFFLMVFYERTQDSNWNELCYDTTKRGSQLFKEGKFRLLYFQTVGIVCQSCKSWINRLDRTSIHSTTARADLVDDTNKIRCLCEYFVSANFIETKIKCSLLVSKMFLRRKIQVLFLWRWSHRGQNFRLKHASVVLT